MKTVCQETVRSLCSAIKSLNLFATHSNNLSIVQREKHTTRLYILLLSIIFLILFLYNTFTKQTQIHTIHQPNQALYEQLHTKYADTIECSCINVAIAYKTFMSITPRYHQICSSQFISLSFITQLQAHNRTNLHPADFMSASATYFTWIASFCILTQTILHNAYISFQTDLFVNAKLLAPECV